MSDATGPQPSIRPAFTAPAAASAPGRRRVITPARGFGLGLALGLLVVGGSLTSRYPGSPPVTGLIFVACMIAAYGVVALRRRGSGLLARWASTPAGVVGVFLALAIVVGVVLRVLFLLFLVAVALTVRP